MKHLNYMESSKNNKEQAIKSAERYAINGDELRAILSRYGLKHEEFGIEIGKSAVTIRRWISEGGRIKLRYAQILEELIGNDTYLMLITEIREEKRKRDEEYKEFLKECERKKQENRK